MVPDSADLAVDGAAAREVGERAIEFTHEQIAMPAPSEEQRVVRLDLEPRVNVAAMIDVNAAR